MVSSSMSMGGEMEGHLLGDVVLWASTWFFVYVATTARPSRNTHTRMTRQATNNTSTKLFVSQRYKASKGLLDTVSYSRIYTYYQKHRTRRHRFQP